MKTKDILTITSSALATASLVVLTFWSASTEADGDGQVVQIAKPTLVANGVEMTLTAAGNKTFKAGDKPAFELTARNTTAQPAEVAVRVAMSASSPSDMLSRVIRMPVLLWQEEVTLALKPNESKNIAVSSETKLPANQHISVSLRGAGEAINPAAGAKSDVEGQVQSLEQLGSSIVAMNFSTAQEAQVPLVSVNR